MLNLPKLALRNFGYHWRGNLAVLLGVVVGSAVLTGALFVGDSLRGSLRAKAERQLAGVDHAALFPMPVRADLAEGLPGNAAPVLMLPGSMQSVDDNPTDVRSVGRVAVIGIDSRFAANVGLGNGAVSWNGTSQDVALSPRIAAQLHVGVGDRVRINVEQYSDIPRSSSFARRGVEDVTTSRQFTVAVIFPPEAAGNDFTLAPSAAAPMNVFVPLATLSTIVVQNESATHANAIFASGASTAELDAALAAKLTARDYGLRFRSNARLPIPLRNRANRLMRELALPDIVEYSAPFVRVESERMILSPDNVEAVLSASRELGAIAEPTVVYVADTLACGELEIPYAIVCGLNPKAAPPLGPFLPAGVSDIADGEVVLLNWFDAKVKLPPAGSSVRLTYYDPEVEGNGRKLTAELTLRGYLPLAGAANDRSLTPEIRGMTDDISTMQNWDRPPMLPRDVVQARVPDSHPRARFWSTNHSTPMAYVSLATAEKLFGSRYGSVTSVRVAPGPDETARQLQGRLPAAVLKHLDPKAAGFTYTPVRERLMTASRGGNDFGMLFLAFSCFLIAAALMLVGLLFRLSLDRRAKEVGLLLAAGYRRRTVLGLVLAEGFVLTVVGSAIGLAVAVAYNRLLLRVLLAVWPDPDVAPLLQPHTEPVSFSLGFGLTLVMSLGALWLGVRGLVKVPPPALLRGETTVASFSTNRGSRLGWVVIGTALVLGLAAIFSGKVIPNPDYQAMTFFAGGGMLLLAALAAIRLWMNRTRHSSVNGRGVPALIQLGVRNAARNPTRSLLTAALLASAAFLLVAVESFRRQPDVEFLNKQGGSGGFNLIAETDVPLYEPLDTKVALDGATAFALQLRDGDDASCMNLYRATKPRVLGVPNGLIERGGFKFYATEAASNEEQANPWLLLRRPLPDGVVPVFVENNTAVWMLKTGVGGEVTLPDNAGGPVRCRIVGTLVDSPFQSELIAFEDQFQRVFPDDTGSRVFLLHTTPEQEEPLIQKLQAGYRANGLIATRTKDRVASYQAVIGAYLTTFQLLGGFGLLLGVLGLAVVILRSVWERLGELALLRAVGYRTRTLQFLVIAENTFLLAVGLGSGILAALASVAPHVLDGASVPWAELLGMLALVFLVGLGVASAATAGILRVPVIPALRRE